MPSDSYREAVQPEKVENTEPQKSGDGAGVQTTHVDIEGSMTWRELL